MNEQLDKDLKTAMLAGEKERAEVIRSLKNALLYEAVSLGIKDKGLDETQAQTVLGREAKKRQEAADLYSQAGEAERAKAELAEKTIIDAYLPEQASEADIEAAVKAEIAKLDEPSVKNMGQVIGAVRAKFGAGADGATIAKLVKQYLERG